MGVPVVEPEETPVNVAALKLVLASAAEPNWTLVKSAFENVAPFKVDPTKSAPDRFDPLKFALVRSAPWNCALVRFRFEKLTFSRFTPSPTR